MTRRLIYRTEFANASPFALDVEGDPYLTRFLKRDLGDIPEKIRPTEAELRKAERNPDEWIDLPDAAN